MSRPLSLLKKMGIKPTGISGDSRRVEAGGLFLAYPGESADGRKFIAQAVEQGASAVLWERKDFAWNQEWRVPNLAIDSLREQAGFIADEFYGQPSKHLWMIGVTGTNGKTSCSHWLAQALNAAGRRTAVIGTLGNGFPGSLSTAINTTPDPILLHGLLADYVKLNASAVAMEVSSHGLEQGRVNGVHFNVAVFTNLSRDHLDFHGDMAAYGAAKKRLFDWSSLNCAVLNLDDEVGREIAHDLTLKGKRVLTYGLVGDGQSSADIRGSQLEFSEHGLSMQVDTPVGSAKLKASLLGRFNAYNLLAVLGALLASDVSLDRAVNALGEIKSVAGRMQQFGGGKQPLVVVDYAHSPDALEKVLTALREQTHSRLICVFGCGGNRDQGKRPLMGEVAGRLADEVVVTSDNPRNEDPAAIIQAIVAGMHGKYQIEQERAIAIQLAVSKANTGDIVLVAGKGHENYQEIAGVKHPFSDQAVVQLALQKSEGMGGMMTLSEAAVATQGHVVGQDVLFTSVGTDSRNLVQGQLFVALRGKNFDGHAYAVQAIQQGAAAVMVSAESDLPSSLIVKDTRLALGDLAAYWRNKFDIPLVAITGSNGKTTVKEMLACILRTVTGSSDAVLATQGNLNNDIGLPLTLLKLGRQHRYAVAEMGMNHTGEISYLTKIGRPTVALVNNATSAHLGELGSIEAIARAKGEIFEGLAGDGIAVINADDAFAPLWKSLAIKNISQKQVMTFGLDSAADVSARYQLKADCSDIQMSTPQGGVELSLPVAGVHNVRNALAAATAALAMGVPLVAIAAGLESFHGVKGRLQYKAGLNGALIIDDTYNANPISMKAAIDVLANRNGEKLLLLGDMGELGKEAAKLHAEVGDYARQAGIKTLFALGDLSRETVLAFGEGAQHYDNAEALAADVIGHMNNESVVLVKGSRFMRMERVVDLITADLGVGKTNGGTA